MCTNNILGLTRVINHYVPVMLLILFYVPLYTWVIYVYFHVYIKNWIFFYPIACIYDVIEVMWALCGVRGVVGDGDSDIEWFGVELVGRCECEISFRYFGLWDFWNR